MGALGGASILQELVLAVGAALAIGNLAVVRRERRRATSDQSPRPNMRLVALNVVIGTVLSVWAIGSLLVSR